MNSTIGTTRVANTIFIKSCAREFGLRKLRAKSTILEKFFGSISWVPELKRSRSDSNEFKIIWFFRPLNVVNGV
jgi:hypothetical protein